MGRSARRRVARRLAATGTVALITACGGGDDSDAPLRETTGVPTTSTTIATTTTVTEVTYIIQRGDSFSSIANQFDITVAQLITINNIEDADHIEEGQILIIVPALTPVSHDGARHDGRSAAPVTCIGHGLTGELTARFIPLDPRVRSEHAVHPSGPSLRRERPRAALLGRGAELHHGKHHKAYVEGGNKTLESSPRRAPTSDLSDNRRPREDARLQPVGPRAAHAVLAEPHARRRRQARPASSRPRSTSTSARSTRSRPRSAKRPSPCRAPAGARSRGSRSASGSIIEQIYDHQGNVGQSGTDRCSSSTRGSTRTTCSTRTAPRLRQGDLEHRELGRRLCNGSTAPGRSSSETGVPTPSSWHPDPRRGPVCESRSRCRNSVRPSPRARSLRWCKQVGERIAVDEALLEVSTDKVDAEVPSPVAGEIVEILVAEGDTVPIGARLAVITGVGWHHGAGGGSRCNATCHGATASRRDGRRATDPGAAIPEPVRASSSAARRRRPLRCRDVPTEPAVVPFTNIRKRTAENLTESLSTSAHTLVVVEVDYDGVERCACRRAVATSRSSPGRSSTRSPSSRRSTPVVGDDARRAPATSTSASPSTSTSRASSCRWSATPRDSRLAALAPTIADWHERARSQAPHGRRRRRRHLHDHQRRRLRHAAHRARSSTSRRWHHLDRRRGDASRSRCATGRRRATASRCTRSGNLSLSFDHRAFDGAYASAFLARRDRPRALAPRRRDRAAASDDARRTDGPAPIAPRPSSSPSTRLIDGLPARVHLPRHRRPRDRAAEAEPGVLPDLGRRPRGAAARRSPAQLRPGYDWFFPYYRDQALVLGLGVTPTEILLQAVGSADDPASGGRQMPCHWGSAERNIVTQSSPPAASACPRSAAPRRRATSSRRPHLPGCVAHGDELTYVSLGEGATSEGEFWESLNTACTLHLPVLYVVADNGYAISVPSTDQAPAPVSEMVRGLPRARRRTDRRPRLLRGARARRVDHRHVRAGVGPGLDPRRRSTRPYSHSLADTRRSTARRRARRRGAHRPDHRAWQHRARRGGLLDRRGGRGRASEAIADVAEAAAAGARRAPARSGDGRRPRRRVLPDRRRPPRRRARGAARSSPFGEAIKRTLHEQMARDERIRVFGEDVADAARGVLDEVPGKGGVFGTTYGLQRAFGMARCFNTPLAEANIIGRAVGQALRGLRPAPEIQFFDYIWPAMHQIKTEAATIRWRSNGAFTVPDGRAHPDRRLPAGRRDLAQPVRRVDLRPHPRAADRVPVAGPRRGRPAAHRVPLRGPGAVPRAQAPLRQGYNRDPYPAADWVLPFGRGDDPTRRATTLTIVTWGATVQKSHEAAPRCTRARRRRGRDHRPAHDRAVGPRHRRRVGAPDRPPARRARGHAHLRLRRRGRGVGRRRVLRRPRRAGAAGRRARHPRRLRADARARDPPAGRRHRRRHRCHGRLTRAVG